MSNQMRALGVALAVALTGGAAMAGEAKPSEKPPMPAAEAKKEVTLKGIISCASCAFKVADKCHTAIKVTESGKDTIYLFDAKADKEHHGDVCEAQYEGIVTGVVSEKDGKKYVTASKVEKKKKL